MKSPEAVLRNALLTNAAVSAVLGSRIYPLRYVGPSPVQFPLIIWRRARILREQTLGSPMGVPRVTVEFYLYAETYTAVRDLADKCRVCLDGYGGTFDNVEVKQASLEDESDDLVTLEGAETSLYSVLQTYDIRWQET
jgi:hypothetical protein